MICLRRSIKSCLISVISVALTVSLLTVSYYIGVFIFRCAEKYTHPVKYSDFVTYYSELYCVPKSVVYAVILVESDFDIHAVSKAGACGLMQLMPATYEKVAEGIGRVPDMQMIFDPGVNIDCGVKLISMLYSKYGRWDTVYAAYNAGEVRVDEWLGDPQYSKDGMLTHIPITETSDYVKKVSRAVSEYHRLYGI